MAPAPSVPPPPPLVINVIGGTPPSCGQVTIAAAYVTNAVAFAKQQGWVGSGGTCASKGFAVKGGTKALPASLTGYKGHPLTATLYTMANNVCSPSPCLNGGTCAPKTTAGGSSASCVCKATFGGARCEVVTGCMDSTALNFLPAATKQCAGCCAYPQTSACKPTPTTSACKNGAPCVDTLGQIQCFCSKAPECVAAAKLGGGCPYYGQRCESENKLKPCEPNPCQHGTCVNRYDSAIASFNCTCKGPAAFPKAWAKLGTNQKATNVACSVETNSANPSGQTPDYGCLNTGASNYNAAATVDDGSCVFINCFDSPCQNGGSCTSLFGRFACACPPNYGGPTCVKHDAVNQCNSSPCKNGGTCLEGSGSNYQNFVCLCPPTFKGLTCATPGTPPPPPVCVTACPISNPTCKVCAGCSSALTTSTCQNQRCTAQFAIVSTSVFSGVCANQQTCLKECQDQITSMLLACDKRSYTTYQGRTATSPGKEIIRTFDSNAVTTLQTLTAPNCNYVLGYDGCSSNCSLYTVRSSLGSCIGSNGLWTSCSKACSKTFYKSMELCRGCTDPLLTSYLQDADRELVTCSKQCSSIRSDIQGACCTGAPCLNSIPPDCSADCATTVIPAARKCPNYFLGNPAWTGLFLDCGGDLDKLKVAQGGTGMEKGHVPVPVTVIAIFAALFFVLFVAFLFLALTRKRAKPGTQMEPILDNGPSIYDAYNYES